MRTTSWIPIFGYIVVGVAMAACAAKYEDSGVFISVVIFRERASLFFIWSPVWSGFVWRAGVAAEIDDYPAAS